VLHLRNWPKENWDRWQRARSVFLKAFLFLGSLFQLTDLRRKTESAIEEIGKKRLDFCFRGVFGVAASMK
jgi:hypothetical protein